MNLEIGNETLAEFENAFKFNDAVIRRLVVKKDGPVSAQSPLFKAPEEEKKGEYRARKSDAESGESEGADVGAEEAGA